MPIHIFLDHGEGNADQIGSVLSRTGYIISFANFPIVCASKIQMYIALWTTEAEYIIWGQIMRDLIPFRKIMFKVSNAFGIKYYSYNSYTTTF